VKCPTYQLHQGIWRTWTCQDLLPNKLDVLVENLVNMSKTFRCCNGSESNPPQEGCAHLEICVPLAADSIIIGTCNSSDPCGPQSFDSVEFLVK